MYGICLRKNCFIKRLNSALKFGITFYIIFPPPNLMGSSRMQSYQMEIFWFNYLLQYKQICKINIKPYS